MNNNKGQSLIEILFSITVVILVLTGVVSLMVKVLNVRGEASLRQKAGNLSTIIIVVRFYIWYSVFFSCFRL